MRPFWRFIWWLGFRPIHSPRSLLLKDLDIQLNEAVMEGFRRGEAFKTMNIHPEGVTFVSFSSPFNPDENPTIGAKLKAAAKASSNEGGYKNVPDDHDGATFFCPLDGLRLTWHEDQFYCHAHGLYDIRVGGRPATIYMRSIPR